jgi:Na+-translocating ferredoxin:NAD+ oxidoreductase subunit D
MANETKPGLAAFGGGDLTLTTSPHSHSGLGTARIMWIVNASLLPCLAAGVYFFGPGVVLPVAGAIVGAVGAEWVVQRANHRPATLGDGSAILTGLLLGLVLPPGFSPLAAGLGGVVAIGIGKAVFGGLGNNIFNPALVGRAFLQACFPAAMTRWAPSLSAVDAVSAATPLGWLKFSAADVPAAQVTTSLGHLFWGNVGGCIGETSAAAIVVGGIILLATRVANGHIIASMLVGGAFFGGLFQALGVNHAPSPLFHLLAGGYLFGAVFMATDYVTSPTTRRGQWVFGLGIGLLTILIRLFGGLPEGVMYSILLMNAAVPLINRGTRPRVFGATA